MLRFVSVPFAALVVACGLVISPLRPALAEALFTSPVPDWVIPVAVPAADPVVQAAVTDGVLTLLSDEQIAWEGEERQIYVRSARLITDQTGVAVAGQVHLTFAPDAETVLLNRVTVTRGTQVTDLTGTVTARTLDVIGSGLIDVPQGQLAAEILLPDLQVGDVVDVAYLRRQLPVVGGVNRAGEVQLEGDAPVVLAQVVVNWPENWPIYISGWPARVGFVQQTAPGVIRHIWTREGHVPTTLEPLLPPGYGENTIIAYSAFPDWSAIIAALSAHYMGSYPLGAAWDARLRMIQTENSGAEPRAIAALRAVQNDLRNESGPLSADGWLARLPADVTAAGAGDAKAKALLLRTMLDKMGIEAYVALTSRAESLGLNTRKPAFAALDHAIVKVVIEGATYWMDPSASHEAGDIYTSVVPDLAYALPLAGADQQQLEPIDPGYSSTWSTNVIESYNFTLLGVYLTVATTHYGPAANAYRQAQAGADAGTVDANALAARVVQYPGLRMLGPVAVLDDPINNQLTQTERFLLPVAAFGADGVLALQMVDATSHLSAIGTAPRVAPLYLGRPVTYYHQVNITNAPVDVIAPTEASVYNDAFNFSFYGYAVAQRDLTVEWSYNQYLREVPAEAAAQMRRDADVIDKASSFALRLRP